MRVLEKRRKYKLLKKVLLNFEKRRKLTQKMSTSFFSKIKRRLKEKRN